jgi:hypothetical protein
VDSTDLGETKPLGRTRGTLVPRDPAESRKLIERLLAIDQEKAALAEPTAMSSLDRPALERIAAKLGPDELADHYLSRLLVVPPRGETRLAISRAVADCPPGDRPFLAVKLVIASPEYQME